MNEINPFCGPNSFGSHTILVKYEYDINGGDCITEKNTEIMSYTEDMQRAGAKSLSVCCELLIYFYFSFYTQSTCVICKLSCLDVVAHTRFCSLAWNHNCTMCIAHHHQLMNQREFAHEIPIRRLSIPASFTAC